MKPRLSGWLLECGECLDVIWEPDIRYILIDGRRYYVHDECFEAAKKRHSLTDKSAEEATE